MSISKIVRFMVRAFCLAILLVAPAMAQTQKPDPSAQDTTSKTQKPLDSIHDTIPNSFKGNLVTVEAVSTKSMEDDIKKLLNAQKPIPWTASDKKTGIEASVEDLLLFGEDRSGPASCGLTGIVGTTDAYPILINKAQVYIFHIVLWTREGTKDVLYKMRSSSWYAYKLVDSHGSLEFTGLDGTGDQFIYGKTSALIIGISKFVKADGTSADYSKEQLKGFADTYSATVTQGTSQAFKDLGLLLAGLGGFGTSFTAKIAGTSPPPITYFVTVGCQQGTSKLPFSLAVTDGTVSSDKDDAQKPPSAGTIGCAKSDNAAPCTSTHSFAVTEKGWWDVSIGVTVPGTRETKYTFSSGSVQTSVTRHTDLYALLDIFPWANAHPKDSIYPHINAGVPLTSQSLYRPYFGLAESLTGWTGLQRKLSLPVGVNFFAGVVFMKTKYLIDNPTTQQDFNSDLKSTRVWKGVFGIEVPISSFASKLGGKGNSAKGGSGKS
jgi:hypothetical protein